MDVKNHVHTGPPDSERRCAVCNALHWETGDRCDHCEEAGIPVTGTGEWGAAGDSR